MKKATRFPSLVITLTLSGILILFALKTAGAQTAVNFQYILGSNDFHFPENGMDNMMIADNSKAFFYGETHTRFFEPMFKLHYIIYLNSRYQVKDVFMEMGYSAAVLFNKFLQTGDTSLIDIKVLYTTPKYMEMWKGLYQFNSTLPNNRKLSIHGVDFEATSSVFRALLFLRQPEKQIPSALTATFAKLSSYANDTFIHNNTIFFQKVREVRDSFQRNKKSVATLYGENLRLVNNILNNDIRMNEDRDKKIYDHMLREIAATKISKFAAFYGGDHVSYEFRSSVGARFKRNPAYKGKITSIRMFCFNAYDNWSHEILNCIGTYSEKEGQKLKQRYINDKYRAVLISDFGLKDKILNHSADYYLFANDQTL